MEFKGYFALLLKEATRDDIKKYYPQIDDKDYIAILDKDPTGTKERVGNLSRLALDLYKKDKKNFKIDDNDFMHDIFGALDNVQKKKNNLSGTEFEEFKNLNKIGNIEKLLAINNFLVVNASKKIKLRGGEGENYEVLYENSEWEVLIPKDYKTSVRIGRDCNASWCTASSNADQYYKEYTEGGDDLYIFKSKKDDKAYQYHSRLLKDKIPEFNDKNNNPVPVDSFQEKYNLQGVFRKIKERTSLLVKSNIDGLTIDDFKEEIRFSKRNPYISLLKKGTVDPSEQAIENFNRFAKEAKEINSCFVQTTSKWLTKDSKKHLISLLEKGNFGIKINHYEGSTYVYVSFEKGTHVFYLYEALDCKPLAVKRAAIVWKEMREKLEAYEDYNDPQKIYDVYMFNMKILNDLAGEDKNKKAIMDHFGQMYQKLNSYEETSRINKLEGDALRKAVENHTSAMKNVFTNIQSFGLK